MPSRLHDNIGAAEKEATDGDSRALSFGFEQVTQLVFPSIDQSREVPSSSIRNQSEKRKRKRCHGD